MDLIRDKEVKVALAMKESVQLAEARILKALTKEVMDKVLAMEQVRDLMVKVDQILKVLVMDRTVAVLRFQEVRTPLLALPRKSLDVVTVTRTELDSVSRVTATVNPSTVSSPGWWQF